MVSQPYWSTRGRKKLTCSRQSKDNKFFKLKVFSLKFRTFPLNSREIPNFPLENKRIFVQTQGFLAKTLRFQKFCCSWSRTIGEKSLIDNCFLNILWPFVLYAAPPHHAAMGGYAGYAGTPVRNGGRPFERNPTTWVPQAPMRNGKSTAKYSIQV